MSARPRKIVFVGDAGVGKTSIIHKKVNITDPISSTVSASFQVIDVDDCQLALWDTAGQERFRSITAAYFRDAAGIVLVCDWSSENALTALEEWHALIVERNPTAPLFIVISKVDLPHVVSDAKIKAHVEAWDPNANLPVINVSCVTGEGIDILFEIIAQSTEDSQKRRLLTIEAEPEKKESCC